jgi:hypothetical protein
MNKLRTLCAVLLALPLVVFGANYFLELFELEQPGASAGERLLISMRDGGLMGPIAVSHVLVGLMMLVPRLRFMGGLLQLPISLGIVAFHVTMMPAGLGLALLLLALNLGVLSERSRLLKLIAPGST